mgnify:CR=1 FL=1
MGDNAVNCWLYADLDELIDWPEPPKEDDT